MEAEEIALCNVCTDLVSLRKFEAFPRRLLESKPSGEWIGVNELFRELGLPGGDLGPEVFATWLSDPMGHEAYAVILFYDDESKWSMAAHYNRGRLFGSASSVQALQTTGANFQPPAPSATQEPVREV